MGCTLLVQAGLTEKRLSGCAYQAEGDIHVHVVVLETRTPRNFPMPERFLTEPFETIGEWYLGVRP